MAEREKPTKEELIERAWARWFEEDFSWDGLGEQQISGDGGLHGEKTLQDYWRRDPKTGEVRSDEQMKGELVKLDGTLWHVAHLPPRAQDGSESWKTKLDDPKWTEIESLIDQRVSDGQETDGIIDTLSNEQISGSDGRAQLAGAVMRRAPRLSGPLKGPGQAADGAAIQLDAPYAVFLDTADFSKVEFGSLANFFSATFLADADFISTSFSADANFISATFAADAYFISAAFYADAYFSAANFSADAAFYSATFSADAEFISTAFCNAYFRFARFENDVWFARIAPGDPVQFAEHADFSNAEFEGVAHFTEARFDGAMRFTTARFMQFADFRGVSGPAREADWRGAFDGAIAFGTLDWRPRTSENAPPSEQSDRIGAYHMISAFAGAKLKEGIYYPAPGESVAEVTFENVSLQKAMDAGMDLPATQSDGSQTTHVMRQAERDRALAALESGAQVLKLAMDAAKDNLREQRFYRFELIARREQSTTKWPEKVASWIFAKTSSYGASLVRPLVSVVALILSAGVVYSVWGALIGSNPFSDSWSEWNFWNAMSFSAQQTFRPFGVWWPLNETDHSWGAEFLRGFPTRGRPPSTFQGLAARIVASLQSVSSVVFLFLFVLAMRRRFQMN